MRQTYLLLSLLAMSTGTLGCASDTKPVDVNGTYNLNVTNGPNGCELANYTVGQMGMVAVTLAQDLMSKPDTVTIQFQSPLVALIFALTGIPTTIVGTVKGNHIDASGTGNTMTTGTCMATRQVRVETTLNGNTLENGVLTWSFLTNGSSDCGVKTTCETKQSFNGLRP